MALETPFHVQGVLPPGQRHFMNGPMARRASDSLIDMDAMVKINKIRQLMDPDPFDRLVCFKAFSDRLQHGTIFPKLGMAVHAGFSCGHPRESGGFNVGM